MRRDTYRHLRTQAGDERKEKMPTVRSEERSDEIAESIRKLMELAPEVKMGNAFD